MKDPRGKNKRLTKAEAMDAVINFGTDLEAELIRTHQRGRLAQFRKARKSMAIALLKSVKELNEVMYYMTELLIIESGKHKGGKTYNKFYYIKDDEIRDEVTALRVQLFSDWYF